MTDQKPRKNGRRTWATILFVLFGFLTYAYGIDVTDVNLDEIESEQRQTNLFRIVRALAHPDILARDTEEVTIAVEIFVPCGPTDAAAPDTSGPYLELDPSCADPEADITVSGFGFVPGSRGPISFIPPSDVSLSVGEFIVGDDGSFSVPVTLKDRPDEVVQHIRVIARQEVGGLKFTETARLTFDFALETVFMALLATTIGTILAVPLSFLASRNLMRPIKSPMVSLALGVIGIPVGGLVGIWAARLARGAIDPLLGNAFLTLLSTVVLVFLLRMILRRLFPEVEPEDPPTSREKLGRFVMAAIAAIIALSVFSLLADFLISVGTNLGDTTGWFRAQDRVLEIPAGPLYFISRFVFTMGDIFGIVIPVLATAIGAGVFAQLGSMLGRLIVAHVSDTGDRILRYITAVLAGAVIATGIGAIAEWFYEWDNLNRTFWGPALAGGLLGVFLAFRTRKFDQVASGMTIYYMARTLFNSLRSIEPLVMAIIFVVWVGVGPFAGALALALHTTASLAKLYSEQVESISAGPIEAVQATGANRLQTVMYAVVPQIVPPYISFTLYRWDINVRMSTIIGFVGGGGLGLLLQQNVNLLLYRAAAVQMFAIAIIVATMDYVSARLRERLV